MGCQESKSKINENNNKEFFLKPTHVSVFISEDLETQRQEGIQLFCCVEHAPASSRRLWQLC